MDKFDQPELHPRGFPLWVEILLVAALILTPLVMVFLWQAWQDHQEKHTEGADKSTVVETEIKTPEASSTADSAETKPSSPETKTDTKSGTDTAGSADSKSETPAGSTATAPAETKSESGSETKTSP